METNKTTVIDAPHAHRWRIDEPQGQISRGICRTCGAEKLFKNWLEDSDFITNTEHRMAA